MNARLQSLADAREATRLNMTLAHDYAQRAARALAHRLAQLEGDSVDWTDAEQAQQQRVALANLLRSLGVAP